MQSNLWVTNGNLGSKDAVLVFRTSVLTSPTSDSQSTNSFDHELYPDTPSASSTCAELTKVISDKSYITALSLPQSINQDRRIDSENFNFVEKKTKKRMLESSSSTSSSSSLNSSSMNQLANVEANNDTSDGSKDIDSENKENIIVAPIDKDEMPAAMFNITYKFLNTETRLLRKILNGHGMYEVAHDANDWNLLWTGNQLKPDMLRNLSSFQRINHFPR